jgi:hypothetical protein
MKKISGYVLTKETNTGIQNLVVSVFDSDREMNDIINEHKRGNAFPPKFIENLGKRLGSVLTDKNGRFFFTTEDLEFAGNETRPDLFIIVFAPEDSLAADRPYALPPEQRILHISRVPRMNAGAEEAYIIRLLRGQLDHITEEGGDPDKKAERDSQTLVDAITGTLFFRQKVKDKLTPYLNKEDEKNQEFKEKARTKLQNFSTIPAALRAHPLLISDKENLKEIHKKVINDGLSRLSKYEGSMQLRLSKSELEELGLEISRSGQVKGEIKSGRLWELMKKTYNSIGGVDLIRKEDLNTNEVKTLYDKYTSANEKVHKKNNRIK